MRTPCRRLPGRHLRASNKPGAIHTAGGILSPERNPGHFTGTMVEAAVSDGYRVLCIEKDALYVPLVQSRLDR